MAAQIREEVEKQANEKLQTELAKLDKQKEELKSLQLKISQDQANFDEKLTQEKKKLWAQAQSIAKQQAQESMQKKVQLLEEDNQKKAAALQKAEGAELEIRKERQQLEERSAKLELEVQRKLDEERKRIAESTKKMADDEHHLKMAEKEKQLEMMRTQIEELKRKSEQGSMQIQGEVQEDNLKELLSSSFPTDQIQDVEKGIKGADLIHHVSNGYGQPIGTLLWESKNTKAWSPSWIQKLKDDQMQCKAGIAILVSTVLPTDISSFGQVNGVWVVAPQYVLPLTQALRAQLLQVFQMQRSMEGKDQKMELLYTYLSGHDFRNRVEAIVTAFATMKEDLEKEKRAFDRIWKKREQEIERVIRNTSGMYGDLQGIIGSALPTVKSLELPSAIEDEMDTLF